MKHRARTYLQAVAIGLIATACSDNTDTRPTTQDIHDIHNREFQKEKSKRDCAVIGLIVMGFALCANMVAVLVVVNRSKNMKTEAQRMKYELRELRKKLTDERNKYQVLSSSVIAARVSAVDVCRKDSGADRRDIDFTESHGECLKKRLVDKFRKVCPQLETYPPTKYGILADATYATIQSLIARGGSIPDKSPLWREIEEMILRESPDFKTILCLLVGGPIEEFNYQMTLLIRCGIRPSKISKLVNKAKNSISTRRSKLTRDIFGNEKNPKYFDYVVLLI